METNIALSKAKFTNGRVSIIGVSVKEGQQLTGVEQSP
jgi:arginase